MLPSLRLPNLQPCALFLVNILVGGQAQKAEERVPHDDEMQMSHSGYRSICVFSIPMAWRLEKS
jgi:hypothetical protein